MRHPMHHLRGYLSSVGIGLLFFLSLVSLVGTADARGGCFAAGTQILTPDGERAIETLHP